jgi:extracellular factor (EF) 3-hydroxypalmitic acid methyl ester biosynthesis protein
MFPATILLQQLTESDITVLISRLRERQYLADELIIREGEVPGAIYFVVNGLVSVYVEGTAGQRRELAQLGAGEIVGDVSWLERRPASASVRAQESSLVAAIAAPELDEMLTADAGFASRFHRGLAVLNASRVRRLTGQLQATAAEFPSTESSEVGLLLKRLVAFKEVLLRADREAINEGAALPRAEREALRDKAVIKPQTASEAHAVLNGLLQQFNAFMNRSTAEVSEYVKQTAGALAQRELLPYMLLSRFAERCYSKPRGYAGDYETILQVYENKPQGTGRLGPLLDSFFLAIPAARAVRNRRALLAGEIQRTVSRLVRARVTSLACGPAQEAFDAFSQLPDTTALEFSAIDIDPKAIEFVKSRAATAGLARQVSVHRGNLVYLSGGRENLPLKPQALVYSIGLIDYFQDEFVVRLLNWIHGLLEPGGRVILGNFHPRNPDRALLDYLLDWRITYRTEEDMNRLFRASKFNGECSRIIFEGEEINLFAEAVRVP